MLGIQKQKQKKTMTQFVFFQNTLHAAPKPTPTPMSSSAKGKGEYFVAVKLEKRQLEPTQHLNVNKLTCNACLSFLSF
jgi:hypothetical protein